MKNKLIIILMIIGSIFLSGCLDDNSGSSGKAQSLETKLTDENQQRLIASTPPPILSKSLERENIKKRLELLNDNNKVFYVYLVSYGQVMAFYTTQTKVSSLDSYMITSEQVINDPHGDMSAGSVIVENPDLDGTYGTNGEGIFFFTTEGAYVEWKGDYLASDFPLPLDQPVIRVRYINST